MAEHVEVQQSIASSPDAVYDLVSDVTRMGEWSPETTGCEWAGRSDGPAVGAKFRGRNRLGWHRWSMPCIVKAAEPGRRFTFDVVAGPILVSTWEYRIEPDGDGCIVTEAWTSERSRLVKLVGQLLTGVKDRAEHNREGMEETLRRLAAVAEAKSPAVGE